MKALIRSLIVSIVAVTGAAHAEVFYVDVFDSAVASKPIVATEATAHAYALAEMHMRRLAGLHNLSIRQRVEKSGFVYAQAKARYDRLVASAQFGKLVAALERNPHLEVVGR